MCGVVHRSGERASGPLIFGFCNALTSASHAPPAEADRHARREEVRPARADGLTRADQGPERPATLALGAHQVPGTGALARPPCAMALVGCRSTAPPAKRRPTHLYAEARKLSVAAAGRG